MSDVEYPEWQLAYRDALLECDPLRLPEKIFEAEISVSPHRGGLHIF